MSLSPSDDSTVSAFLSTLSLEEHSHLTPDLGTVPIHNAFPIDLTHAALLRNYPLLSSHLDNLKHQFEQHQMEQYLIFDINTGSLKDRQGYCYDSFTYFSLLGCDTGMGNTVVSQSQVTQVWVRFPNSRPKATP